MTAPTPNAPAEAATAAEREGEEQQREFRIEALLRDADLRARWLAYYLEPRRLFSSDSATLTMALDRACAALLAARRDADALAEWNAMLDEAAPQDVKAFADKTNGDLAETLRWMRRYVPTGFHALLNATIDRLLAARREVEALRAEVGRVADKCDNDGRAPHASAKPYLALCDAAKLLRAALAATPEEK